MSNAFVSRSAITIGLSVLAASSYIVVVAPELLVAVGIPRNAAFVGCLISTGAATLLSGWLTRTPLIIAPAVGMLAFTGEYYEALQPDLSGYDLLVAGVIGGGIALALSWKRREILEEIPTSVRLGINGAVGALLAKTALGFFSSTTSRPAVYGVIAGAITLLGLYVSRGRTRASGRVLPLPVQACVQGYFFCSFAAALLVFLVTGGLSESAGVTSPAGSSLFVVVEVVQAGLELTANKALLLVPYILVMLFVLLTDIPGTPFALLDKPQDSDEQTRKDRYDRTIRNSFITDGLAALLYPFFGMTTPIYYSENNVIRELEKNQVVEARDIWTAAPAVLMGVVLLSVAALFILLVENDIMADIPRLSPALAAPIVLFLGCVIMADGMVANASRSEGTSYHFYLPAAASIVVTTRWGLAFGLSAACLVYFIGRIAKSPEIGPTKPSFAFVVLLAAIAAAIQLLVSR